MSLDGKTHTHRQEEQITYITKRSPLILFPDVGCHAIRGLPFMTSAPRGGGGGPKIGRFCGQTVNKMRMKGEGGV